MPLIHESDIIEVKTLIETDEWLKLILVMQNEIQLKYYTSESIIERINSSFQKIRSMNQHVISIDPNRIDKIIRKQYGQYPQSIIAGIADDYIFELGRLS